MSSGPSMRMPDPVQAPKYENNPGAYQGFDTTGLSQGAIAQGNQAGSNQIAQAKAQAAGMGGGRSSAVNNQVGSIQTGLGQNAQNIYNQNAAKGFQQQLEQMGAHNAYNLQNQANQNQAFGNQANAANQAFANQQAGYKNNADTAMTAMMLLSML